MLTCYVTPNELYKFIDIQRFVKDDSSLTNSLSVATLSLATELREKGIDVERLQPPQMFDSLASYGTVTKTADHTATAIESGNRFRFVVKTTSQTSASFRLQGSHDNTTFYDIHGLDGAPVLIAGISDAGVYTALFYEKYPYIRYVCETSESVTYSAYLVDTSVDDAIRYKAVELYLMPYLDRDTTVAVIHGEAQAKYQTAFASMVFEYGSLTDDGVETNSLDTGISILAMR